MKPREFFIYTGIVALFALSVDGLAYVQLTSMIHIPAKAHFFVIPTLVGLIFGLILVMYRHYYSLARQKEHFERLAKTDTLTGCMSRYACELILDHESKRCIRSDAAFSLLMVDIDNFKDINDRYGHIVGDRILKEVCDCLNHQLRKMDTLCRWGGEEFLIILPEMSSEALEEISQRLLHAVQTYDFQLDRPVTVSIGGACNAGGKCDPEELVNASDKALYRAKQAGKNRSAFSQEYALA